MTATASDSFIVTRQRAACRSSTCDVRASTLPVSLRFCLLIGIIGLSACSDSPTTTPAGGRDVTIELQPKSIVLDDVAPIQIGVVVRDRQGEIIGALPAGTHLRWASTDPEIASVDANGSVQPVSSGTATITAELTDERRFAATSAEYSYVSAAAVGTTAVKVTGVAARIDHVSGNGQTGVAGAKLANDVVVRAVDKNGSGLSGVGVNFVAAAGSGSFSPSAATTDSEGIARASWTLGSTIGSQSAEVRAQKGKAVLALSATATSANPEACLSVTPATATLTAFGSTVQLTGVTNKPGTIAWSSSAPAVAVVNSTGLVAAQGNGSASITASLTGCIPAVATITVQQAIASVTVSPSSASVEVNQTVQLTATARDANGNAVSGTSFTWASSNSAAATVNGSGLVTGQAAGSATVSASASGKSGGSAITVTQSDPGGGGGDFAAVIRGIRPRGYGATAYSLRAPAAGGTTYFVAISGSDSNPGTSSAPFRTINKAAQVALAGDVVTIRDGSYQESVFVANSGTDSRPIVFQAENRGGAVLTGGQYTFQPAAWTGEPLDAGQFYITLNGLVFRTYSDPYTTEWRHGAVRAVDGWRIEHCLFDQTGQTGILIMGDSVTVTKSTFQYNFVHALVAFGKNYGATGPTDPRYVGIKDLRLNDLIIRGNYTSPGTLDGRSSSSVIKIIGSRGTIVDNIESFENNGPGLWLDADNFDYVVRNSYFHNNFSNPGVSPGRGLHLELSWGPALVENNVITHNAAEGIAVSNAWGVEIRNNLLVGNRECMRLSDWVGRSGTEGQYALRDVSIHHNQFRDWTLNACISPYGDRPGGFTYTSGISYSNITLDYNTYHPITNIYLSGYWSDRWFLNTIEQMRSIGTEYNGAIGSVQWPI